MLLNGTTVGGRSGRGPAAWLIRCKQVCGVSGRWQLKFRARRAENKTVFVCFLKVKKAGTGFEAAYVFVSELYVLSSHPCGACVFCKACRRRATVYRRTNCGLQGLGIRFEWHHSHLAPSALQFNCLRSIKLKAWHLCQMPSHGKHVRQDHTFFLTVLLSGWNQSRKGLALSDI